MNYYAVQVRTGKEEQFIKLAKQSIIREGMGDDISKGLIWPRRNLFEKRLGKRNEVEKPLYPGYVFFNGKEIGPELHWIFRRTPGFFRFLNNNYNIQPLSGKDLEVLIHFLGFGEVAQRSKVYFDKDNRIRVISGPMSGLEGIIERVDRRKGRAKIRLSLNNNSMLVDLGFDVIESSIEDDGKQR